MYNNRRSSRQARRQYITGGHPSMPLPIAPQLRSVSLPLLLYTGPRLHTLLRYAARPRIVYDLRRSSSDAEALSSRLDWMYDSATFPHSLSLTLVCTLLHERIIVFPSCRGYNYVTLNDVLSAAHEAYQRAEASSRPADVERVDEAVPILFSRHSTAYTRYMWAGLSDYPTQGTWLLHIEEPH